jgi:hypothetical protein
VSRHNRQEATRTETRTFFPDRNDVNQICGPSQRHGPTGAIVQEVLAQIPWYHHIALLDILDDPEQRLWYARRSTAEDRSYAILTVQIENRLIERQGRAQTNFPVTLPPAESHSTNGEET